MVSPKTYRGYNSENKCISQCTAVDANTLINPAEVKKAIENVKTVFAEQMDNVAKALTNVTEDASEAVIVQGTDMTKTIEDTALVLKNLSTEVTSGIDTLYDYAVQAHDKLQESKNNEAYNACIVNGVTYIQ